MTDGTAVDSVELEPRRRRPLSRSSWAVLCVVAVLAIGALVAWPLGGWDTVDRHDAVVPEHPLGEPFAGQHFTTTVHGAWTGVEHPNGISEPSEGMQYLFVVADVRNEWIASDSAAVRLLAFTRETAELDVDTPRVQIVSDGTSGLVLPPGVTTRLRFTWEVPTGTFAPGDRLVLGIVDGPPSRAVLSNDVFWHDDRVVVTTAVVLGASRDLDPIGGLG